jgi:hypothetical protein
LHSLQLADFDNDGDIDIFTVEMALPATAAALVYLGERRWQGKLAERVILDANLGDTRFQPTSMATYDIDICAKP